METAERNKFPEVVTRILQPPDANRDLRALVSPVIETLGLAMVLLASVMGGYLVLGQHTHILGIKISDIPLTHGDMSVFFAMLAGMSDPARRLSGEFSFIQQGIAAADRVYDVLDREPTIVDPAEPAPLPR